MAAPIDPIDPRVRLAISLWPEDAPRGAVSTFCALAGVTYKVAGRYGFHHVLVITEGTTITVTDLDGES